MMVAACFPLWAPFSVAAALFVAGAVEVPGQEVAPGDWNDARVMALVERAQAVRQSVAVDPALRSYQAEARGYVYFFVDRPDSPEQILVKADQVALDVFWQAPNSTKQRIVGLRDQKVLPTGIRYHLDHLTVVQDDFGDFIRLGDGDEVEKVLHPVGPASQETYDFQLADSLTLSYAAGGEVVRVYEVRVRPRNFDDPGFVGTVFLDRDRAAVVRMNFSFTPASYVDPYLDYIRISLDNSLWMGAYWLPYKQEIEIRRETPLLDFMAGSIIRNTFDIRGYDFNVELPAILFTGAPVSAVSPAQQRAFAFERGLFDDLEEQGGLAPSATMEEVQAQVDEVVEGAVMSGLSPVRLHLAGISDIARYNRAEGLFLGGGMTLRPRGGVLMRTTAGYSIGRRSASGAVAVTAQRSGVTPTLDAYWDAMGDIGGHPGATLMENTITSLSGSRDYLDPYFRRGATLTLRAPPEGRFSVALRVEDHRSARDVVSDGPDTEFRPVLSVHEGTLAAADVSLLVGLPGSGQATIVGTGGRLGSRSFASLTMASTWAIEPEGQAWTGYLSATGGITNNDAPAQTLFMLGGRLTLPGQEYRSFVGNGYWLAKAEVTVPVLAPWLGIRGFVAAGATHLGAVALPIDWTAPDSNGVRGSVGLGLSIGWDAMRFDVGRAVRGGGWEAVFSVAPQFRAWM